jgi:glycosyltransferase involved in cell wall biosynthesis
MNKKVVLLGPSPPPHGGVSIYVSTLFEHLRPRGLRLWTYGDREVRGANVRFMKDKRRDLVPLLLREGRSARLFDCTHFLLEYPSALVPVWALLKRVLGFEWVKILHDGSLPVRHARFGATRRALFRLAARSVTEFVAVSEELARWLREEVKVTQPVTLVGSLLPVPYRDEEGELTSEIDKGFFDALWHARRVCCVGAFIPEYGFLHAARAVERLRHETGEDLRLLLIDGGFVRDEAYREEVLSGHHWVTVLKNVPHPEVFKILKRCDAFVRAFGPESYGLSRVEAIWAGLPVVATRAGETRGMLLYDYGDVDALAQQLKRALSGEHALETARWAGRYTREAEENLKAIAAMLGLGEV